jgi:hypothetical protein
MCPVWERDDNIEDPAVEVSCSSYDSALNYILNVKTQYPHLRLQYTTGHTIRVWDFASDSERTYFIIKADTYKR